VARMGEGRGTYGVLVREPRGKNTFERPRRSWNYSLNTTTNINNIKMKYSVGCEIDYSMSRQGQLAKSSESSREPRELYNAENCFVS